MTNDKPQSRDTRDNRVNRVSNPGSPRDADVRPDAGIPPPSRVLTDVITPHRDQDAPAKGPASLPEREDSRPGTAQTLATNPAGATAGALGGAALGAVAGMAAGPVGSLAGAAAGAAAGGLAGGGAGRLSPTPGAGTVEAPPDAAHAAAPAADWREHHAARTDLPGAMSYEACAPAYRFGAQERQRYGPGAEWDDAASLLAHDWKAARGDCPLSWDEAMPAVRVAWDGLRA